MSRVSRIAIFICILVLIAVAIYLKINNAGFIYKYKGRGGIEIGHSTPAVINGNSVILFIVIIAIIWIFIEVDFRFNRKTFKELEKENVF